MGLLSATMLAAPGVVLALAPATRHHVAITDPFAGFTPAGVDQRLAAELRQRPLAEPRRFVFTPAGINVGNGRSMTVAVRARGPQDAHALQIHGALGGSVGTIKLMATSYNLGTAHGWQSFAMPAPAIETGAVRSVADLSDADGFRIDPTAQGVKAPGRIAVDDHSLGTVAAHAVEARPEPVLDLGGHYRLTRGVDVNAGVRYKSELAPLTDQRRDSQAVYVGTLIHF